MSATKARQSAGRRAAPQPHHAIIALLAALLLAPVAGRAGDITFESGVSKGVVLQRGKPIPLRGTASPGSAVTITLASQIHSVKTNGNGRWEVVLPSMDHGGPYTLTASESGTSATIDDVWVGDVWLCSGQSNMQMGLHETLGGADAIAGLSRQPAIRLMEMPRGGAEAPELEFKGEWKAASPESLSRFSAVGAYFAAHLRHDPSLADLPLGLINSSFGGTSIEAWSPAASLSEVPKDQLSGSMFGIPPGALYNHMIHPLFARPIKGVLWYQGEANAGQPALYVRLLRSLMTQWRAGWGQQDLPFLVVQLPAFEGKMGGLDFGWLREAQDTACRGIANAWSAVTYDTTDGFDLHPKEKAEIGRRLALIAKCEVYGLDVNAHGPRMQRVETSGNHLIVTFDKEIVPSRSQLPLGFTLAGEDGDHRVAKASLEWNTVTLEAEGVPHPTTVRYAWNGLTNANLAGRDGLPAFPFRTDTRPPESVVFQPLPVLQKIETPVYQLETGSTGCVASLIVGGKQFLSHELNGGACVPGGFGFRKLSLTTLRGPRRLALSDGGVTLELACQASEMTWTLTNHGGDPVDLHIVLGSNVEVRTQDHSVTLAREDVRIHVSGIERSEGLRLIAKAPPNGTTQLHFRMEHP